MAPLAPTHDAVELDLAPDPEPVPAAPKSAPPPLPTRPPPAAAVPVTSVAPLPLPPLPTSPEAELTPAASLAQDPVGWKPDSLFPVADHDPSLETIVMRLRPSPRATYAKAALAGVAFIGLVSVIRMSSGPAKHAAHADPVVYAVQDPAPPPPPPAEPVPPPRPPAPEPQVSAEPAMAATTPPPPRPASRPTRVTKRPTRR
jgi:hypothetical protein